MGVYKNLIEPLFMKPIGILPLEATYTYGGEPDTVQVPADLLYMKNASISTQREIFLKFNVAQAGTADLKIVYFHNMSATAGQNLQVFSVPDEWSASTLTYRQAMGFTRNLVKEIPYPPSAAPALLELLIEGIPVQAGVNTLTIYRNFSHVTEMTVQSLNTLTPPLLFLK